MLSLFQRRKSDAKGARPYAISMPSLQKLIWLDLLALLCPGQRSSDESLNLLDNLEEKGIWFWSESTAR